MDVGEQIFILFQHGVSRRLLWCAIIFHIQIDTKFSVHLAAHVLTKRLFCQIAVDFLGSIALSARGNYLLSSWQFRYQFALSLYIFRLSAFW